MTPPPASGGARLLFVVNNDFGELSLAMLLLHGRALASQTTVMLPPKLFALNGAGLPARTLQYQSADDLLRAVEAEAPDIVVFFSAYLLPAHGLVAPAELERLLDWLRQRGCRLVTTDPFWGLLTGAAPLPPRFTPLIEVAASLTGLVHLFLAPLDVEGIRGVSFFNPSFGEASLAPVPDAFWQAAGVTQASSTSPFWLFPLTGEDYNTQVKLVTKGRFADVVARLMEDTLSAGRWPVLVAPDECLQAVSARFKYANAAALMAYCPHHLFTSLLVHAEHVFYWNAGSTSGHVRLLRRRSQFSFDPGHVGRVVEGWLQQTTRQYFRGRQLPHLDQHARLEPDRLAERAAAFEPAMEDILRHLATAPEPEGVMAQVLAGVEPASRPASGGSRDGALDDSGR